MDGLDLLKKDWKSREASLPHLSYDEIYKMIWKKSSSIVKWIFIISVLEFLFWAVLDIAIIDKNYWKEIEEFDLTEFTIISNVVGYLITLFFIFKFYRNYKRINATDSAAGLMKNILKTRKTVKYYIAFVLIGSAFTGLVSLYFIIEHHSLTAEATTAANYDFNTLAWIKLSLIVLIGLAVLMGLIWLFYRLIYGILLKRLNRNYQELKKLDV
ncbi:hypothetical protein RM553_10350 [Zunongwangia sp. F363]|uniref:Uncharacterized protein n=1 Tax=Autumnicola tepida TaxID=3075595 RepID=A0ABU3CAE6_9FLAO|nr:hypothetical protein [Zunongwangia sp. F363]MDT0643228.1 hypothetical protein [Zunongwangia sp. F363]